MLRKHSVVRPGLRFAWLSLAAALAVTSIAADPADARTRRANRAPSPTTTAGPGYAAIVVDANSGTTLHAANPDATRHPASLTKIMTLYLLFERLESGKLTLDSQLRVSEHAADQSPTKLGLREGGTLSVEEAIKGMVTRSANDAAVTVAENLAGSEEEFARLMTRKARALGMNNTVYRNASGLPDSAQVTTARDQAILGRAIQERFPRYYTYFSTRSFTFRGQKIGNHNQLLGRVEGVDGIKTGYIRASGFNLVTSVRRNGRHVVAVVLGGTSAGARDARMRQLLAQYVDTASTRKTAPMIAEGPAREPGRAPARGAAPQTRPPERFEMASADSAAVRFVAPHIAAGAPFEGSSEPIRPLAVRTVSVRPAPKAPAKAPAVAESPVTASVSPATPRTASLLPPRPAPVIEPSMPAIAAPSAAPREPAERDAAPASLPPATTARPAGRSGWLIQVGAYPAESEALQRLTTVKSKAARFLVAANPMTEPVQRGETTLYRARFTGLNRDQAEAACKFLKRNDVDCLALRN